ncbi:uncharacterized protein HD556DRAFT_1328498 [Suillus plorans]|uniref:Secreted protein n=1 Tax=Suillus plorans TaxID=116603 RepID=A0A9P7J6K5_9AGAM|nr:uncharacterized protein HD556DRAFT_1328498 [Suillus plorans]KAG1805093.1 hypothetical protein HD556DRAFT_1328498 [Suillus plorans]
MADASTFLLLPVSLVPARSESGGVSDVWFNVLQHQPWLTRRRSSCFLCLLCLPPGALEPLKRGQLGGSSRRYA